MAEGKKFKITIGKFDLIKGIAMTAIVLGHMLSIYDVSELKILSPLLLFIKILGVGLNPLFFLICGYGLKKKKKLVLLKKSAKDLLIPYLWIMIMFAITFPIVHVLIFKWWPGALYETYRYMLAFIFGIPKTGKELFGVSLYECTGGWFLLALFVAQNLLNCILEIKKEYVRTLAVVISVILGYILMIHEITFYCIPQGMVAVGYCYIGYIMKQKDVLQKKFPVWVWCILVAVAAIEISFGKFALSYGEFRWGLFDCVAAGAVAIIIWIVGMRLDDIECKAFSALRTVGLYTYWIMCIHSVEIAYPWYVLVEKTANYPAIGYLLQVIIRGTIIFVCCYVIKQISKYKYKKKRMKLCKERTISKS